MLSSFRFLAPRRFTVLASVPGAFVLAYEFGWPRTDFDLDPVATAFGIFCAVLFVLLIGSLVTLSLFREQEKRGAMYHSEWVDSAASSARAEGTSVEEGAEPFIPDASVPRVSASVAEMFETQEK
jgi:hypothetical protein